ncbi:methylated-DNA--[protein]-cysteine S-methyltransferase [Phycisphaeraceae bacterium D3-23]
MPIACCLLCSASTQPTPEHTMHYCHHDSPVGRLMLAGDDAALCGVYFPNSRYPANLAPDWLERDAPFDEVRRQLDAYFAGELQAFDLPLAPQGTDFQQRVWQELRKIPYGETISYGQLAQRTGDPNASRAVGNANGKNPLSIIVPCHRVIGANGQLTGFGGGLDTKRKLLALEQQHATLFA